MNGRTRAAVHAVVLASVLVGSFGSLTPAPTAGDPAIGEADVPGFRNATWDFGTPSNYSVGNVSLARGSATLAKSSLSRDYNGSDFTTFNDSSPNVTVGANLKLSGSPANRIIDGTFILNQNWTYTNASNVLATYEPERANISHSSAAANPLVQNDSMDDAAASGWTGFCDEFSASIGLGQEVWPGGIVKEGGGSLSADVDLGSVATRVCSAQRNTAGTWDWSPYQGLAVWVEGSSAVGLQAFVHLENLGSANPWNSNRTTLTSQWNRLVFDLAPFAANGGDHGAIDLLQIRFTGVAGPTTVFIDDLVLFGVFDEIASVSQDFTKPVTSGNPGGVLLSFAVNATAPTNVSAELRVTAGNFSWSEPNPTNGTRLLDLSPNLTESGPFTLTFSLRVARRTEGAASVWVWIDTVNLSTPDYKTGTYTATPFDASSSAIWGNVTGNASTEGATSLSFDTRSGSTNNTSDGTWTNWTPRSGIRILSPPNRYLQWRVHLTTTNASHTPIVHDVSLTYEKYIAQGTVQTNASLHPADLMSWWRFYFSDLRPSAATLVKYELSLDGGLLWFERSFNGDDLSLLPPDPILVRATLSTTNSSLTPTVAWFRVQYEYLGPLWRIDVTTSDPMMTADEVREFTAAGFDWAGHPRAIDCAWNATSGPDFTTEAPTTATYDARRAGSWRVTCTDGPVSGGVDITVSPGALADILVDPSPGRVNVTERITFAATGLDADSNEQVLTDVRWSTTIGQLFSGPSPATHATLLAPPSTGTGTITAREGTVRRDTTIFVFPQNAPLIDGTIPNDTSREDDPPWSLNLSWFAGNQRDVKDTLENLRWTITGLDGTVVTTFGTGGFSEHTLWVTPVKDAVGTDVVTLWLEDRGGARTGQEVSFTLTPDNDPPRWCIPDELLENGPLEIHATAGQNYTFDFLPYVCDMDNPSTDLSVDTDDRRRIHTNGLAATFSYPEGDAGKEMYVEVTVSDGPASSATLVKLVVTGNPAPQLLRSLPHVTLDEDAMSRDALVDSLSTFFHDPAGEPLTFVAYPSSDLAVWVNDSGASVDIAGTRDFCGHGRIVVRATDPHGAFQEAPLQVTVRCLNDPPVIAWTGEVHVAQDTQYLLDLEPFVFDVDSPLDDLTLGTNDAVNASVDRFTVSFLYPWKPLPYDQDVTLTVSDGIVTSPPRTITVRVTDNRPPELVETLRLLRFDEDTSPAAIDLLSHFQDQGGGPLDFFVVGAHIVPAISANHLTLTPVQHWFGQETLLVWANDSQGAFAIASLHAEVLPVNDAPEIGPIPMRDRDGGVPWVVNLRDYVTDVDNEMWDLTFETNLPNVRAVGQFLLFDFPYVHRTVNVAVTVRDHNMSDTHVMRFTVFGVGFLEAIWWPWSGFAFLGVAAFGYIGYTKWIGRRFLFEDLFVVGREGRLVMHTTRRLRPDRDEDLLAGMLTAIVLFVRDAFREEREELKKFEFGDRKVAVQKGEHVYGAAIFGGEVPVGVYLSMRHFLEDVEERYWEALTNWSGDVEDLPGLKAMMEQFGKRGRYRSGDWRRVKI